ncbi:MAG: 2OG-Fe(II) oxygenase [Chitinophagales bacterium]
MSTTLSNEQLDAFAQQEYLIIDNFLPKQLAYKVLEDAKYWKAEEAFKKAGIGKLDNLIIKESYRSDKIKWINKADCLKNTKNYLDIIERLIMEFNRSFFLSLKDFESMYAIYPEGAFYKKHTDRFAQQPHRIISLVLYLNENWQETDQGQLLIYKENKTIKVNPIFNRLAMFKSELWHEVLPCKTPRYSITTWLKDQYNDINFL